MSENDDQTPSIENGGIELVQPFEKRLSKSQRTALEYYNRYGITEEAVQSQSEVSSAFSAFGDNGVEIAIEYLRFSESKDAKQFLSVYDDATQSEREVLSFEEFATAAQVRSNDLLGLIVSAANTKSANISAIIAAINHPKVVQKTVDMALGGNFKAQELLHKQSGFLPTPKGPQTAIQINNNSGGQQDTAYLPPMEKDIKDLSERFQVIGKPKLIDGK